MLVLQRSPRVKHCPATFKRASLKSARRFNVAVHSMQKNCFSELGAGMRPVRAWCPTDIREPAPSLPLPVTWVSGARRFLTTMHFCQKLESTKEKRKVGLNSY